MAEKLRVAVVGAGIIGLSVGLKIIESLQGLVEVDIISEKFTPETTSDKAGALLFPYDIGHHVHIEQDGSRSKEDHDLDSEKLKQWTRDTFAKFNSLYRSAENADIQICLRTGYLAVHERKEDPWWADCVFNFRRIDPRSREAVINNMPQNCIEIWSYATYIVNCSSLLQYIENEFRSAGGKMTRRKIHSLDELQNFDVVVNCTGLGARDLVEGEVDMKPCRGQTVVVRAPWISTFYVDLEERGDQVIYIFPRADSVVLGGTVQVGQSSEVPDSETAQHILTECTKVVPSLGKATIIGGSAGLRPLRGQVRLEQDRNYTNNTVIHCYGHGGQGVVLSWGCAKEVLKIVVKLVKQKSNL